LNIEHISVSRKSIWEECQLRYKYRYHEKIIPPGEEPFYFTFGKIMHLIAETYVGEKGQREMSDICNEIFAGAELDPGVPCPHPANWPAATYRKRMPEMIRSLERLYERMGDGDETWLEHQFKYDLDPPNEKLATGFIDWLTLKKGIYYIVDYKTTKKGRYRETQKTVLNNLQLRMYARVVQREFNVDASKIKAAIYYLEGANLFGAQFTNESLVLAEKQLLEAYRQIEGTTPERAMANVGQHCARCDYAEMCPFYKV
jgi:CRISPR/Cas system-associated exonuclease Cas4 (RecB family)